MLIVRSIALILALAWSFSLASAEKATTQAWHELSVKTAAREAWFFPFAPRFRNDSARLALELLEHNAIGRHDVRDALMFTYWWDKENVETLWRYFVVSYQIAEWKDARRAMAKMRRLAPQNGTISLVEKSLRGTW